MLELESIKKISRDIRKASSTLSKGEVRFLVDAYYMIQDWRITAGNQARQLKETGEPHEVILWLFDQAQLMEGQVKIALDYFSQSTEIGRWSRSIVGIGPVIAAGLEAHIDIEKAPTVGHIWRFAGLDPTTEWKKGEKRPWNATLKVLCWKIGESFVKVSSNENDIYGKFYMQRKALEQGKNERGKYADQAAAKLEKFRIGKSTDAYKAYSEGKLPPGHIHARAKRWAVKLFLAHWHQAAYKFHYGKEAPLPYPIEILEHQHYLPRPGGVTV